MFDEWIFNLEDRADYMRHYDEVFGMDMLTLYNAKSYFSAPANYGVAFESAWDVNGVSLDLGVNMQELEKLIEERGEPVDVK
jgi:glutaconate CoA-transferase subunit A